jgi:hypothetical protein
MVLLACEGMVWLERRMAVQWWRRLVYMVRRAVRVVLVLSATAASRGW